MRRHTQLGMSSKAVPTATPVRVCTYIVSIEGIKYNMEEDGVRKFGQARGRGGKEAREEEKEGSNQQTGADYWFEKRLKEEKVRSLIRTF